MNIKIGRGSMYVHTRNPKKGLFSCMSRTYDLPITSSDALRRFVETMGHIRIPTVALETSMKERLMRENLFRCKLFPLH